MVHFKRGDRVRYVADKGMENLDYRHNQTGTVTHFHGDHGYRNTPGALTDVWVVWDNASPEWVSVVNLVKIR